MAQCQPYWQGLAEKVWQTLEKKQLNARGVNIKLKLKNFQTLQHSKSFKRPIQSLQDLIQVLFLLLNEMQIPEHFQFRLIGIGVYQLQTQADDFQLNLW